MKRKQLTIVSIIGLIYLNSCASAHLSPSAQTNQSQQVNPSSLSAAILTETKPGGKLDFFTPIKGHEYDGIQLKPGIYSTLGHAAFYQWGKAVRKLGITDLQEAYAIFTEFQGQPISTRDQEYIKSGFLGE